ncbi:MAG: flagellar assembly protein FliW [Chlorobi bacterium]|nr:flagellar assembly protein FliW [Chlorobiota bacterium]
MDTATLHSASMTATTPSKSIRKLATEQFGEILVEERHIFLFADGLLGFDDLHQFIIVRDDRTEPVRWLLSVDHPELSFPVISPFFLVPDYSPGKEYSDFQQYTPLVILTLGSGGATVNLKAPIILDVREQRGSQIIIPSDKYSTAHPIGIQQMATK